MFQVSLLSSVRANQTLSQITRVSTRQLNVQATAQTFKHKLHLKCTMNPEIEILRQTQHMIVTTHTEADTTYDCCDHPEISTLRRTHCNVDRLHFASGLVISIVFDPVYLNTIQLIPDVISPT